MRVQTTPQAVETPAATLWRCGGRQCAPGECDHDGDLQRHASGAVDAGVAATSRHRISSPDDSAELEAERVAARVADGQALGGHGIGGAERQVQRKGPAVLSGAPWEQPEEEVMRRAASDHRPAATADLDERIRAMRGGGRPLEKQTRSFMESRFGHDFGQVRIHDDEPAARTARSVNALAFTVGHDIAFAPGQYRPASQEGRRLLAHELTHVVQQSGRSPGAGATAAPAPGLVQRDLATPPPEAAVEDQPDLTEAQITAAIAFNRARYDAQNTRLIQDILGGPVTGTWTRENIIAIAATQEEYGLTADGKVGSETFRFLNREARLEGLPTTDRNCLTAFRVVTSPVRFTGTIPAAIEGYFRASAEFSSRCRCSDWEYRQFIRGHARHIRGAVTTDISNAWASIPGGRLPANFVEDGDTTDNPVNYGHRNQPADNAPEDHYINDAGADDQANGCRYRMDDHPGLRGITGALTGDVFDINMNFRGEIQRNGRVVQTKHWTAINGRFTIP